ncbi:MAG: YbjQ family protein [Bifidobacteriaceae bacterium]|nr:YbjQ family protein [Bifidobacteriaceae bacterium]
MIVVTMNEIPGYQVDAILGEVMGVTVRSRDMFSQMGAGLKAMVGGELKGMTSNLYESRVEATNRMTAEAGARGGNAVIAVRFDASDLGGTWTELCAYGTAAVVSPIPAGMPGATAQSASAAAQPGQPR